MTRLSLAETVGLVVGVRRKQAGLSQVDLAEVLGVDSSTLSRMERSAGAHIDIDRLAAIAAKLNMSPAVLLIDAMGLGRYLDGMLAEMPGLEPSRRSICELAYEWLESQGAVAIVRCLPPDAAAELAELAERATSEKGDLR